MTNNYHQDDDGDDGDDDDVVDVERNYNSNSNSNSNSSRRRSRIVNQQKRFKYKKTSRLSKNKRPFNFKLWIKSFYELILTSMFFAPLLAILSALLLGIAMAYLDFYLYNRQGYKPPLYFTTNASSARTILSTIAAATISFAGTAFSVSLLVIQLTSTQFSPRVVHTLFKDPYNRRVVAMVMGTFTYCLVVMRSIEEQSSSTNDDHDNSNSNSNSNSNNNNNDDDGQEQTTAVVIVPNTSVAVAFLLGIASLLATVAFIDHSAGYMDVSKLFERITQDTLFHIQQRWDEDDADENDTDTDNDNNNDNKNDNDSNYVRVPLKPKPSYVDEGMEDNDKQNILLTTTINYGTTTTNTSDTAGNNNNDNNNNNNNTSNADNDENGGDDSQRNDKGKGEDSKMDNMDDCYIVRFQTSGWVQEIDTDTLLTLVPPNGYIRLYTLEGRYAFPGAAMCSVFPRPAEFNKQNNNNNNNNDDDDDDDDSSFEKEGEFVMHALDTVMIGYSRSIRGDATYGLRQLVDIVLRALSPGINDPTTAQDGIFHIAAVVSEFLQHKPPAKVLEAKTCKNNNKNKNGNGNGNGNGGGKLYRHEQPDYDRIVRLAFEEIRVCCANAPVVALYILEALRLIRESLKASGRPHRAPEIERQARLVEEQIRNASHIPEDHEFITKARQDRFDTSVTVEPLGIRGELVDW